MPSGRMLSLRPSDYLGPQALCGKPAGGAEPSEELRRARSASEGGAEWPSSMSGGAGLPVDAPEHPPWFHPHEPLYQFPAYQRYLLPRYAPPYPLPRRPYPQLLSLPFLAAPSPKRRSSPYPGERPASPCRTPPGPSFDKEAAGRPAYRAPTVGGGREGSLKHRILHPPPSIHIVEPPASLLANAPLSAPPIPLSRAELPRLAVSSMHPPGAARSALHYPAYFIRGSIIQLGTGLLKKVEDLQTQDFVTSANVSRDLRIDSSRVLKIAEASGDPVATLSFSVGQNQVQVTVEAPVEHPFFVFNRGWSSCNPERSLQRYRLQCQRLSVGDVCISLTHRAGKARSGLDAPLCTAKGTPPSAAASCAPKTDPMNPLSIGAPSASGKARKRRWSAPDQVALDGGVTTHTGLPMPERTATT
ncbi:unnamed protein product [Ixodes hexagonus]